MQPSTTTLNIGAASISFCQLGIESLKTLE
jgi:hypothetical protein